MSVTVTETYVTRDASGIFSTESESGDNSSDNRPSTSITVVCLLLFALHDDNGDNERRRRYNMPVHKSRAATGRLQHHQRSTSGGSSRVGLNNLQLTQKEAVGAAANAAIRQQQSQLKRTGHSAVDLHPPCNTSPFPHGHQYNANSRIASKERIAALQQKRAATPNNNKRRSAVSAAAVTQALNQQQAQNYKPEFSIANSDETDEDEWVSSESGAATPQKVAGFDDEDDESESQDTEVEVGVHAHFTDQKVGTTAEIAPAATNGVKGVAFVGNGDIIGNGSASLVEDKFGAPRAELDIATTQGRNALRQTSSSSSTLHPQAPLEVPAVRVQPQSTPTTPPAPPEPDSEVLRQSRSEAPSPTRRSLHSKQVKRHSLMRYSSHGEPSKYEIPHHPLIRGQSYTGSSALKLKPAPLSPLTVDSTVAQVQLSASPTSTRVVSGPSSPTYMTRSLTLQSPTAVSSSGEPERDYRRPSRKTSISSLHSVATVPAPSPVHAQDYSRLAAQGGTRTRQDRTRTLSMMSSNSSSAALTSLNMNMMSRPGSPPTTVRFPKEPARDGDGVHPLLPPPYCAAHLTVTSHCNPLYDCYERVLRAKQGR